MLSSFSLFFSTTLASTTSPLQQALIGLHSRWDSIQAEIEKNPKKLKQYQSQDILYQLGYCYQYGIGTDPDPFKSMKYYTEAINKDLDPEGNSAFSLGRFYQHGIYLGEQETQSISNVDSQLISDKVLKEYH